LFFETWDEWTKEAAFKTKVNEIKYKDVPELNDEIANELDAEANSVDEYKENLRKRLAEQKATEAENTEKEEAIKKATDNATIDIPLNWDSSCPEIWKYVCKSNPCCWILWPNSWTIRLKDDAEQRVKTNLTLTAIADAENIEVSDEDIDKELEKLFGCEHHF
jgi:trigger factor